MNIYNEYGKEIEKTLRLATNSLAIKMLKKKDDITIAVKKPKNDFNTCFSTCQGFALSRRHNMTIVMYKEDMWCPIPVIGYGLEKKPQEYLEGRRKCF